MYCPECRERGQFPWQHAEACTEGLRHQLRWYQSGLTWLLMLLLGETVLLAVAFFLLGRV